MVPWVALIALVGCLRRPTDPVITLTWWITFAADSSEYPLFEAIAQAYTQQTGQQVKLVSVPWTDIAPRGGDTRLALAQKSGRGPDLWGPVPHNWTGSFARNGQALALESTQIAGLQYYLEPAMWACQFADRQYGLPVLMDSVALIYNTQLVPQPPGSMDELVRLAQSLTDPANDRWGLVFPVLSQYHVFPFIESYGGYIFKCERNLCALDDMGLNNQGAVQGVQWLSDLYLKRRLFPESLLDRTTMSREAVRLFAEGKAAMLIDGPWAVSQIRAGGIDWAISSLPPLPGAAHSPRPLVTVQAMYASAYSKYPQEAVELLNFIAGPSGVSGLQEALGKSPVRQDVMRLAAFRENREVLAWYEQARSGVLLPNAPELGYVWYPWGQALDEAIPGLTPTQTALDRAVKQIQEYIAQDTSK